MYIDFNSYNSSSILHSFANNFGARATGDNFNVPSRYGEGFVNAYNFSSDISALISDLRMRQDVVVKKSQPSATQYFVLLFNELLEKPTDTTVNKNAVDVTDQRSTVRLSSSFVSFQNVLKANHRVRSVNIIFHKQALLNFLDFDIVEKFINAYFSLYLKKDFVTLMDANCRWIIQELYHEIETHPLQNLFAENRVLLLLEKFLYNFIVKEHHAGKALQLKEEEISRLVNAENVLLNDFSKAPPTINLLSRLCAMSPTKFKNDFKMLYGLPVFEYYQKNRMAYARSLIQHGEHAIKEVGMLVGYSNLGHFAAAFKKEYGMLPSEWLHANRLQPMKNETVNPVFT